MGQQRTKHQAGSCSYRVRASGGPELLGDTSADVNDEDETACNLWEGQKSGAGRVSSAGLKKEIVEPPGFHGSQGNKKKMRGDSTVKEESGILGTVVPGVSKAGGTHGSAGLGHGQPSRRQQ
ncbi:hypothetical protein NDU88_002596 [Pleurodeles waltl]|uniref:Uncharacterized protein n=1 Tax=Pleurodeles waltl TaxID=8319 RepID=A0AAV7Q751_PLEWA|nr:hypothetical protein NDU88_002596 [Pleurodeles waltl]